MAPKRRDIRHLGISFTRYVATAIITLGLVDHIGNWALLAGGVFLFFSAIWQYAYFDSRKKSSSKKDDQSRV